MQRDVHMKFMQGQVRHDALGLAVQKKRLHRATAHDDDGTVVDLNAAFEPERKKVRFTTRGHMALAIRRCISNASAARLGAALLMDVSGNTITRSEIDASAAHKAAFHTWHTIHEAVLAQVVRPEVAADEQKAYSFGIHAFSADATNTACWHNSKLQALLLSSSYLADTAVLEFEDFTNACRSRIGFESG